MKKFLLSALAAAIGLVSNFVSAETVEVNMMTGTSFTGNNTFTVTNGNAGVKLTSSKATEGNHFKDNILWLESDCRTSSPQATITLESTDPNYVIKGFSMSITSDNGAAITLSSNNQSTTLSATSQEFEITGLNSASTTFTLSHPYSTCDWEKAKISRFVVSLEGETAGPDPDPDPQPDDLRVTVGSTTGSVSGKVWSTNAGAKHGLTVTISNDGGAWQGADGDWMKMTPLGGPRTVTIESTDPAYYVKAFTFKATTSESVYINFASGENTASCINNNPGTLTVTDIEEGTPATFTIQCSSDEYKKTTLTDFYVDLAPIAVNPVISVEANAGGQAWIGEDREHHSFEFAKNVTSVTLHAEADTYYEFAGWLLGEEIVSTEADYTISTRPTEHMTHYVATFTYHGNYSVHLTEINHRLMIYPSALNIDAVNTTEAKTKSYSIGMWFKCTNTSGTPLLMNYSTSRYNNKNGNWCVSYNVSDGKLALAGHGGGTNGAINANSATGSDYDGVNAGEWNHLMVTIDQPTKTFKAYVNGQLAKTCVMSGQDGIYLNVDQGEREDAHFMFGSMDFSGYIDEVQLFSSALTADEVTLVYKDVWYAVSYPRNAKARYNAPNQNGGAYNISTLAALYTFDSHTDGNFADILSQTETPSFVESAPSGYANDRISMTRTKQTSPTIAETGREVQANGSTVSISEISADSESSQGIYDLQGRRLVAPAKGINIINGKKVLVK